MTNLAVHFKGKLDALVSVKIQIKGHSNLNDYFTFFRIQQNTIKWTDRPPPASQPEPPGRTKATTKKHTCTNLCALVRSNAEPVSTASHAVSLHVSIGTRSLLKHCVDARSFWCVLCHPVFVGDRACLVATLRSCHSIVIQRDMLP